MNSRTLQDIADLTAGRVVAADPTTAVRGICTDTRTLRPGELFVALKGETHDGHDYIGAALAQGAAAALVSVEQAAGTPQIVVADTLLAYGQLGAAARSNFDINVIAVTGSAGKTTTKDMIGHIVSNAGPSLVSPGTQNNEVGVPRLLLELAPEHRFCVVELAMRGPGEIAYLAGLCRPRIGVITNVGDAHLGRLGSREAIARAKAELLEALPPEGTAVLNADDFFFGLYRQMCTCQVTAFGLGDAPEGGQYVTAEDVRVQGVTPSRFRLRVGHETAPITLQVPGRHSVLNALAAAGAALAAGVSLDAIRAGLEDYGGSPMRSQVLTAPGGYTIINDAYNASPTSTPEALRVLGQCGGNRVFVFGDMLELGPASEEAHRRIGKLAAEHGVNWLVAIGRYAALAAEEAEARGIQANVVADTAEAVELVAPVLAPGDTVLVKASRGMALETVVEGLLNHA